MAVVIASGLIKTLAFVDCGLDTTSMSEKFPKAYLLAKASASLSVKAMGGMHVVVGWQVSLQIFLPDKRDWASGCIM